MTYENPKDNLAGEPGKIFVKNLTVSIYDFTVKISAKYGATTSYITASSMR